MVKILRWNRVLTLPGHQTSNNPNYQFRPLSVKKECRTACRQLASCAGESSRLHCLFTPSPSYSEPPHTWQRPWHNTSRPTSLQQTSSWRSTGSPGSQHFLTTAQIVCSNLTTTEIGTLLVKLADLNRCQDLCPDIEHLSRKLSFSTPKFRKIYYMFSLTFMLGTTQG